MEDLRTDPKATSLVRRRPRLMLLLSILGAIGLSAVLRFTTLDAVEVGATPVIQAVLSDRDSPAAGAARPDLTIVVFTDYQCPVCKATDPALERLLARDPGVRVVFKDWPNLGPASEQAARLALAAQKQGRYTAFHRALMANRSPLTAGRIAQIAAASGLDWTRMLSDLATDQAGIDARLKRNAGQAWSLGLEGTPGYLVGPLLTRGGLDDVHLAMAVSKARRVQRRTSRAAA